MTCIANAHLRGKIELAKIGERSEQNSQLYFVPLEILIVNYLVNNLSISLGFDFTNK
jgi:hypothetical protein